MKDRSNNYTKSGVPSDMERKKGKSNVHRILKTKTESYHLTGKLVHEVDPMNLSTSADNIGDIRKLKDIYE